MIAAFWNGSEASNPDHALALPFCDADSRATTKFTPPKGSSRRLHRRTDIGKRRNFSATQPSRDTSDGEALQPGNMPSSYIHATEGGKAGAVKQATTAGPCSFSLDCSIGTQQTDLQRQELGAWGQQQGASSDTQQRCQVRNQQPGLGTAPICVDKSAGNQPLALESIVVATTSNHPTQTSVSTIFQRFLRIVHSSENGTAPKAGSCARPKRGPVTV